MTTITTTAAVNLAHQYHDVMNMVSKESAFGLPVGKSPRQALEGYLQACKVCGVKMHNDAWEAHAEKVVETLTQKRRQAWADLLGRKNG
jgi:hypothetical protein